MKVAVVAHAAKKLDGGLPELRRVLETEGVDKPLWYEVPKAKKASEQVQRALDEGAELVFAWGGDGTVRRCVDTLAGTDTSLAVVPAGTANLFATNLGIPTDIEGAVAVGLRGHRRRLDVGRFERGALRRDGRSRLRRGHDPRRRRAQGAYGPRRISLERVAQPPRRRVRSARSRSTGPIGTRAGPRASCSATWARSSAGSGCFPTRVLTTACWSSGS